MTKTIQEIVVSDSPTVLINTIAQQKIDAGINVFNLSAGEPKLPPHPLIMQGAADALTQGKTFYPPVSGMPALKVLACEWMNSAYACQFEPENCLVVNGGKLGIYLLLQLLLNQGDEVLIVSPYWVSYPTITTLFGGVTKIIETSASNGWKLTPELLKKACGLNTKILILNNGTNPTGALYSTSELAALLKIAYDNDLLIISDEVYSGLSYDDSTYVSCGAFPEYQQRVVIIQSCSKNFSMTGWRVGFVFAPNNLIKALSALISQSTSGVTTISQWAAISALTHVNTINTWVKTNMQYRRNILITALEASFAITINYPRSALYVLMSLQDLGIKDITSTAFCELALTHANVALVPGDAFGKQSFVRLSFGASPSDLTLGVQALADFCKRTF